MGATYQTVADATKTDLDRIRQEAATLSAQARTNLDSAINSATAAVIRNTPSVKRAIESEIKKIILAWDATH